MDFIILFPLEPLLLTHLSVVGLNIDFCSSGHLPISFNSLFPIFPDLETQ